MLFKQCQHVTWTSLFRMHNTSVDNVMYSTAQFVFIMYLLQTMLLTQELVTRWTCFENTNIKGTHTHTKIEKITVGT
jgi:hypothetical protein